MDKSIEVSGDKGKKDYNFRTNLVLTIDSSEKIVKFNKQSQDLSGFSEKEVIYHKIFGFLIPNRYENQWSNLLRISRQNKIVDNIKLPLVTKNGHEIMISWISFPVKDENGKIGDINFIGSLIKDWNDIEQSRVERKFDNDKRSVIIKKVSDNHDSEKIIMQLQKLNNELMKKNIILEKNLKTTKEKKDLYSDKKEKNNYKSGYNFKKNIYNLSEYFGGKKRKEEFQRMIKELEERENFLNEKESELVSEKRKINEKISEFKEWRKKLESLEIDIENRRKKILYQEEKFLTNVVGNVKDIKGDVETTEDLAECSDFLDDISDGAVVIQRGIIKKVNDTFLDLIGYDDIEIVEKSLFDFVSPEGFYEIERYYLNRLKGESVPFFNTILLSKDNNKIPVEINSKPTFFDQEKAEIAVIKKLDKEEK
jgi:PAS domain S-box-containing protein